VSRQVYPSPLPPRQDHRPPRRPISITNLSPSPTPQQCAPPTQPNAQGSALGAWASPPLLQPHYQPTMRGPGPGSVELCTAGRRWLRPASYVSAVRTSRKSRTWPSTLCRVLWTFSTLLENVWNNEFMGPLGADDQCLSSTASSGRSAAHPRASLPPHIVRSPRRASGPTGTLQDLTSPPSCTRSETHQSATSSGPRLEQLSVPSLRRPTSIQITVRNTQSSTWATNVGGRRTSPVAS